MAFKLLVLLAIAALVNQASSAKCRDCMHTDDDAACPAGQVCIPTSDTAGACGPPTAEDKCSKKCAEPGAPVKCDPLDTKYLMFCEEKKVKATFKCPGDKDQCNDPGNCGPAPPPTADACKGNQGKQVPKPPNCQDYLMCVTEKDDEAWKLKCDAGKYYNPEVLECLPAPYADSQACMKKTESGTFPYLLDETKYIFCQTTTFLSTIDCPAPQVWDTKTKSCKAADAEGVVTGAKLKMCKFDGGASTTSPPTSSSASSAASSGASSAASSGASSAASSSASSAASSAATTTSAPTTEARCRYMDRSADPTAPCRKYRKCRSDGTWQTGYSCPSTMAFDSTRKNCYPKATVRGCENSR